MLTREQVAAKTGLSPEQVRRIEEAALRKLGRDLKALGFDFDADELAKALADVLAARE